MMKHPVMGFEHLHRHSDFSLLDGFARVDEYAVQMKHINQKYLCITDHGVMGAVPQQIAACDEHKLYPIFGCELYVNNMQPKVANRNESAEFRKSLGDETLQKKFDKSNHLLAIAYNMTGYSNLVRLTSWGWIHGYYRRPRVNHEVLNQYKEGIIFTSTCANSEIATAFFSGGDDAGFAMIEKYMAMFGKDFYLELMMLDFKDQKPYDAFLLRAHLKYGIPLILTQDCHYCKKEHSHNQKLMLLQKGKRTLPELQAIQAMIDSGENEDGETPFEAQDDNLWMKSEDELDSFWEEKFSDVIDYELYKIAKANTVKLAELAKGVKLDREIKLPRIPDADDKLWQECLKGFKARNCPKEPKYIRRLKEEYELIKEKGFASYFLIQKMMVDEARDYCRRVLGFEPVYGVGPGRGSVCGSLLAYVMRLHDLDPILHDLKFSRFLSPARGGKQTKFKHTIQPVPHENVAA
jgi:DNA polymerase-3 subunit alpha